jgi:hypothetical protein
MWVQLPPRRGSRPISRVRVPAAHPVSSCDIRQGFHWSRKQLSNKRMKLTACGRRLAAANNRVSYLSDAAAFSRSLCADR